MFSNIIFHEALHFAYFENELLLHLYNIASFQNQIYLFWRFFFTYIQIRICILHLFKINFICFGDFLLIQIRICILHLFKIKIYLFCRFVLLLQIRVCILHLFKINSIYFGFFFFFLHIQIRICILHLFKINFICFGDFFKTYSNKDLHIASSENEIFYHISPIFWLIFIQLQPSGDRGVHHKLGFVRHIYPATRRVSHMTRVGLSREVFLCPNQNQSSNSC